VLGSSPRVHWFHSRFIEMHEKQVHTVVIQSFMIYLYGRFYRIPTEISQLIYDALDIFDGNAGEVGVGGNAKD
jgi:hypothetical protein